MARNINGGTDRIAWTPPAAPPNAGCLAFFMRTTQTTTNSSPASYCDSANKNGYIFVLNNTAGKLLIDGNDATTNRIRLTTTSNVNNGAWRHIAVNYDRTNGGANALFVDGTSEATGNSSAAWTYGSAGLSLILGDALDTFWQTYVGDFSLFGHWNAKLDAAEIAALAKGFSPSLIRPSALLEYAPLIRDANEIRTGLAATLTGTTVSDHPRVFG